MDAPQAPIDISVTLGSPKGAHNLLELHCNLTQGEDKVNIDLFQVKEFLHSKNINEGMAEGFLLAFDLHVQPGR